MADKAERRWVWYSGYETVEEGKTSILALVETLAAISITVGLALYFETLTYIALTVCIAPVLLLRTPESTEMALRRFMYYEGWCFAMIFSPWARPNRIVQVIYFFFSVVVSIAVKISVTTYCTLRHPLEALRHVPENWERTAVRTDSCRVPELIPGYEAVAGLGATMRFGLAKYNIAENWRKHTLIFLIYGLLAIVILLPALLYRFSLKSSSIVYLPLIYISGGFSKPETADIELDTIRHGPVQRMSLYYAMFALLFLTFLPLVAYSTIVELKARMEEVYPIANEPWFRDLLGYWIYVYEWKPLYAARAISAALTVALFLAADSELRKRKFDQGRSDRAVNAWLGTLKVPRFICVAYTTGFGLFTIVPYIEAVHLPRFVWDWWPN